MNLSFLGWDSPVAWPTEAALYLLLIMFVVSVALAAVQALTLHADRKEFRSLTECMYAALRFGRTHDAISVVQKTNDARIKQTNALRLRDGDGQAPTVEDSELIELAKQSLECLTDLIQSSFRKKQNYLATISATAPFVGLFGTVMHLGTSAVRGCAGQQVMCLAAAASGTADSLWPAVFGMVVAFAALLFYRYFHSRIEDFAAEMEISSLKFLSTLALSLKQRNGSDAGNHARQSTPGIGITFDREAWLKRIKRTAQMTALVLLSVYLIYVLRPARQPAQPVFSKFYLPLDVISSAHEQSWFYSSECRANVIMVTEWDPYVYTVDGKGGRWPFGCYNLRPGGPYFGRWISDDHTAMSIGMLKWSIRWHMAEDHIVEENDLDNIGIWTVRLSVPE
jgi:biopolymer transport protein TolQ